jgi:hypothetical protein
MGAAISVLGEALVLFVLTPGLIEASSIMVSALFVWLLLRGSRFAWTVLLIGVLDQIALAGALDARPWEVAAEAIAAVGLLAPPSFRFVWAQHPRRPSGRLQTAARRPYKWVRASAYSALCRIAEWEDRGPGRRRSYGLLLWRLGVACVLLLPAVGLTYGWQQDFDGHNHIINAIAKLTWACYALVQLTFIVFALIAVYRHLADSWTARGSS